MTPHKRSAARESHRRMEEADKSQREGEREGWREGGRVGSRARGVRKVLHMHRVEKGVTEHFIL